MYTDSALLYFVATFCVAQLFTVPYMLYVMFTQMNSS